MIARGQHICIITIIIGVLLTAPVLSDAVVHTELETNRFNIGDAIKLFVHVDVRNDARILFPSDFPDIEPFAVLNRRILAPKTMNGYTRYTMELTISIYNTGEFEFPALEIAWEKPDGTRATGASEPLAVDVESILTDDQITPRSLKPPLDIPARARYILSVLATFTTAAILLTLLMFWLYKRKHRHSSRQMKAIVEAPVPADQEALKALAELQEKQLVVKGDLKAYFVILSEILKVYIGRRYAFNATERTTGEIRNDMRRLSINPLIQTDILQLLELADMVKFARYKPADEMCRKALNDVEDIVLKSREPQIALETADKAGGNA